jgi:hypothetical protein
MKTDWFRNGRRAIVTLLLLVSPVAGVTQDMPAGRWAGTWIADLTKSRFPGPVPQLDQVTIQPDGSVAVHVVSADGKTTRDWSYKPQADSFVPITGRDHVLVKVVKVNAYLQKQTWNKSEAITESYSTLSKDGKTQIYHSPLVKDSTGHVSRETVVYRRR